MSELRNKESSQATDGDIIHQTASGAVVEIRPALGTMEITVGCLHICQAIDLWHSESVAYNEMRRELAEAKRSLSDSRTWVSVEDRLPVNAEHVLVQTSIYRYPYTAIRGEGHFSIDGMPDPWPDSDDDSACVTHWMPLPEPPKEAK